MYSDSIIIYVCLFGNSIDKVPKVTSPVLVIHGTEDEVIDFSHGVTIYEKCPRTVEPLWVEVIFDIFTTGLRLNLNLFRSLFFIRVPDTMT